MKDVRDFLIVLLLGAAVLIVSDRIWFHGQYFERAQQEFGIDISAVRRR
jgi:hypothetical protein